MAATGGCAPEFPAAGSRVPDGEVVLRRIRDEHIVAEGDAARLHKNAFPAGSGKVVSVHVASLADEAAIRAKYEGLFDRFAEAVVGDLRALGFRVEIARDDDDDPSHAHVTPEGGPGAMGRDKMEDLLAHAFRLRRLAPARARARLGGAPSGGRRGCCPGGAGPFVARSGRVGAASGPRRPAPGDRREGGRRPARGGTGRPSGGMRPPSCGAARGAISSRTESGADAFPRPRGRPRAPRRIHEGKGERKWEGKAPYREGRASAP